uniref:Major facilitator superfamily (MFS) profile domain-containing protein n=1 Tax=Oryza barthii TaxID=65489 RepID=A0A0D3G1R8_9ORYZ
MGLPGAEPPAASGGGLPGFFGGKSKYVRMNDVLPQEQEEDGVGGGGGGVRVRRSHSSRRYVFACSVFASLNSVLLGYDVGVMSGCILFIQRDLHINEVQQEVLVGCLSFISLLGSLAGGRTSDAVGRKWTIGLAAIVFQAGAAVMTLAPSFEVLMVGRLLAGVGIGFGVMIAPVYIAEISPAASRGSFTSFPEIFINLGILLGYISNYAFSGLPDHVSWRVMLAVGILPSVSIAFALLVIPESPRWLVMQNRADEAREVLLKVTDSEDEAKERLAEIEAAAAVASAGKYGDKTVWQELTRPSPVIRRMLITGLGIQCFQQITGIDALVYYSPTIFRDAGITTESKLLVATVAVGFFKTAFIALAIVLIDRVGRKPLLYVSTVGMTACLVVLAATLAALAHGSASRSAGIAVAILTVCGDVAFFSVGIGPICWVMSSEIFPLRLRSQAAALGAVMNRVTSGAVAMSFLSVCRAISVAGAFSVFAVISALSVVFVYRYVPETSGKTLEEIELLFGGDGEAARGEVELGDGEHLILVLRMGLRATEAATGNGGGMRSLPDFLGRKSKYVRMDDVLPDEQGDGGGGGGVVRVRGGGGSGRYVFACSVFASLNHVLLGYDVGVMSGCIIFIQKDLHISEVQQEVLVGCLSFISLLGSLAAGRTSDAVGRKWTIGLAAAVFQAGAAVMTLAPSFAIFISLGILLGYVSNLAFSGLPDHINWRVMLAAGIVPSISVAFVLLVIPESPRWLVMQGRAAEARAVLLKVTDGEDEAQERLAEIEEAARVTATGNGKAVWRELLRPSPVIRRMLVTGIGVQLFQQITGIDALVYYSPTIFRDAGITTESQLLAATVGVGLSKTVFIVIAIVLVDRVGRKPLLYVSTAGMTACLAALAASLSLLAHGALPRAAAIGAAILTVCGFVAFFSVGIGPINMVLSSEIYPLRLRAQAVALGFAVNRLTSGAVAMSFLSICGAVSVAGAFAAFAAISALSVVFVHVFVPETSGKSLEQIESLFGGGAGAGEVELGDAEHLVQGKEMS